MTCAWSQAAHLHAGVQAAPGWQLHSGPHRQAGVQAQGVALLPVETPGTVEFTSKSLSAVFIGCSRVLVIERERLYPQQDR